MMLSLLMMGCGSGGGSGSGDTTGSEESGSQPIDSGINESSAASESGVSNPSENFKEGVTIVVNENYTLAQPDWEKKIKDAVDFINIILNRNEGNKKQIFIAKIAVYPDVDIGNIYDGGIENKKFIFDNKFPYSFGTTIVLFIYNGENNVKIFNRTNGESFHRMRTFSSGKKLEEVWSSFDAENSPFTNLRPEDGGYERMMQNIIHEIGHASGLAEEELYRYFFNDMSEELPNLKPFCPWMRGDFLHDPMYSDFTPLKFSDFNSWIINMNAEHPYSGEQIAASIPEEIKVSVVDECGVPVAKAKVKVFAALWGDVWDNIYILDPILLLETETDENGEAAISSDDSEKSTYKCLTVSHRFSSRLPAKIVKVSAGDKYAGAYLLLYDLEKAYLQDKQNVYTLKLKLEPLPF